MLLLAKGFLKLRRFFSYFEITDRYIYAINSAATTLISPIVYVTYGNLGHVRKVFHEKGPQFIFLESKAH